ncbi:MAG: OmpH family outer membrane protein [Agriterribacter sp.]
MKYLSLVLSIVALILVGVLFYQQRSHTSGAKPSVSELRASDTSHAKPLRIAYVDLDSIEAKFDFYKSKMDAFEKRKDGLDRQLNGAYQQLDNRRIEFLKKGNSITQAEAESFKREYDQQLQELENRRRKTEQEVQQEAMIMRDDIFKKINEYLTGYSKEKGYTYIFSYSRNGSIFLYQDPVFNITDEVITGLNGMYKKTDEKK